MTVTLSVSRNYPELHRQVRQILIAGQNRARLAVERERVRTYWHAGQVLRQHFPERGNRAAHAQMLSRLAEDVELGKTLLYEMMSFNRIFPDPGDLDRLLVDLTWTHCRALLTVASQRAREHYAKRAQEAGWSARQLADHIRADTYALREGNGEPVEEEASLPSTPPLYAKRGLLYTYRFVAPPEAIDRFEEPFVDLGFSILLPTPPLGIDLPARLRTDAQYHCIEDDSGFRLQEAADSQSRHYSYIAHIESIIDGDTVWAYLDCGFDVWVRQKLRLRGIDTPELKTARGQRAREFVVERLQQLDFVTVTTVRPDKYDRYLADLFYLPGESDPQTVMIDGTYLNRELVQQGMAVRMTG